MKTITVTKCLSSGRVVVSSFPSVYKIRDLIKELDYQVSVGYLCSYEISIVEN